MATTLALAFLPVQATRSGPPHAPAARRTWRSSAGPGDPGRPLSHGGRDGHGWMLPWGLNMDVAAAMLDRIAAVMTPTCDGWCAYYAELSAPRMPP